MYVHQKVTLSEVSTVTGCSKCDRLDHVYVYYLTKNMSAQTWHLVFSGITFIMASTFYLLYEYHSGSPRILSIQSRFGQGKIFYIALKSVVF